jgi:hypothetical protein
MSHGVRGSVKWLVQSVAASAAMTASQRVEMWVTRRDPSDLPLRALERLTGRSVHGATARTIVGHLGQGSLAAAAIILARTTRRTPTPAAVALIAASLIAGDAVLAVALGLAQAPWRWPRRDLAIDVMHKTSLAIAARTIAIRRQDL